MSNTDQLSPITQYKNDTLITDCKDYKRIKYDNLTSCTNIRIIKPEDIIVCEQQEKNFCGRHALRALAQRLDLFNDEYLMNIAKNLATIQQACEFQTTIQITDYYYKNQGDYNIQILQAAVQDILNIDLVQIDKLENSECPTRNLILSNIQNSQAFLIQDNYHYYCVRRFRSRKDYFFKIDSKNSMYHEPIHYKNIINFLSILLQNGSSIFIIIQHIDENLNEQLSIENIQTKLWPLADAPADFEYFPGLQ